MPANQFSFHPNTLANLEKAIKRLLGENSQTGSYIALLRVAFYENDFILMQRAWLPILQSINARYGGNDYRPSFLDNSYYDTIANLRCVAHVSRRSFYGKDQTDAELDRQIVLLNLKIAHFYSVVSDSDLQIMANWQNSLIQRLYKTGEYIKANSMYCTESDAAYQGLQGESFLRAYVIGDETTNYNISKSINCFSSSLDIQIYMLNHELADPNNGALRDVLLGLAKAYMLRAMQSILSRKRGEIVADKLNADLILDTLTDKVLVLEDGEPDLRRRAMRLQVKSYSLMLERKFSEADAAINAASDMIRLLGRESCYPVQFASIMQDLTNVHAARLQESLEPTIVYVTDGFPVYYFKQLANLLVQEPLDFCAGQDASLEIEFSKLFAVAPVAAEASKKAAVVNAEFEPREDDPIEDTEVTVIANRNYVPGFNCRTAIVATSLSLTALVAVVGAMQRNGYKLQ